MRIGLGAPTALLAAVLLLTIAPEALAVPGNDDLADASDVTALPFVDDVDPVDATVEPGEPSCSTPADINTVWYQFTPSVSGMIRLSAAGLVTSRRSPSSSDSTEVSGSAGSASSGAGMQVRPTCAWRAGERTT